MQPEFGESVDVVEPIKRLLETSPKLCATDAKLVLLELYENTYGIYNHAVFDPDRPMANVAMHPAEDVSAGSLLDERIEQFADRQVSKFFGMSLTEFLQYPTELCMRILEICGRKQKYENTVAGNALAALEAGRRG